MKNIFTFLLFSIVAYGSFCQNNFNQVINENKVYFEFPPDITRDDYLPKTIIFKIKPDFRNSCYNHRIDNSSLNEILNELDVLKLEKKFPGKTVPERATNERGEKLVDLSLIYMLTYNSSIELKNAINYLYDSGIIEYAEPYYVPRIFYTSNDPENGLVYALAKMKVFDAWDISQGDTNVVIGITDTGVDFGHEDLVNNIKYNYNDTINGIDDDGDGYIDNFRGWDTGENDNYPQFNVESHGVHVSGTAAASVDNATGISGVGFKCKFLPVKISASNGALTGAYDGLVYAADHGCQIINCSWGGYTYSQFSQEIINYATFNKNSLVVCASGNENTQNLSYPSSFNNAFSVASTTRTDQKSVFSNYGYHIDISAPGSRIYSSMPNNTYNYLDGTSMASPNVAGAAAIVKSHFPSYSALQVREQLKVTADNINISNNNSYRDKLGTGRINLLRALTDTTSPSVKMVERTFSINNGNAYHYGDTLKIFGEFLNYLAPTSNLSANLTTSSTYVNIINSAKVLGVIPTYGKSNISNDPFKVVIKSNVPLIFKVPFKLSLVDGNYSSNIYFNVDFNLDESYINIIINDVNTSIISNGRIGYLDTAGVNGMGFTYKGSPSMLNDAGLMIGISEQAVSSSVKGETSSQNDFSTHKEVKKVPNVASEFDVQGSFNDNNAENPLNVMVKQSSFAWSSSENRNFVIFSYAIKNIGSSTLSDLYAGIFADWNIMNYKLNKADSDNTNRIGYVWSTEPNNNYTGIKLLSTSAPFNHYAIDNVTGGNGGIDLSDNFTTQEKFISLSTGRGQAGTNSNGTDIISVVSSGPYNLSPGDSAIIAFALLAGNNIEDLKETAVAAQTKYDSEVLPLHTISLKPREELLLGVAYPNPAIDRVTLEFVLPQAALVSISLYNSLGQEAAILLSQYMENGKHSIQADINNFANGIYLIKLTADGHSIYGKVAVGL